MSADLEKLRQDIETELARRVYEMPHALDTPTLTCVLAVLSWVHETRLSRAALESLDARLKVLEEAWRTLNEGCREMMEEDRRQREGES